MKTTIIVATNRDVVCVDAGGGIAAADGLAGERPTCLAAGGGHAWCGTDRGVFGSVDNGRTWQRHGLENERITAVAACGGAVWAGTEPSALWRSADAGRSWQPRPSLQTLPSSPEWSFPPRPETHHVRWIACSPARADTLWVAIEAGALVTTTDAGASWRDRVPGGPYDTHELAVHPDAPDTLRSAAGDGYYESRDGGATWTSPEQGLDVGYMRSVAIDPGDPDSVIVSAASHPHAAYIAGSSDGRLYRRSGGGAWRRVTDGWPEPPDTIAPLLAPGLETGELWAADERGVHRSRDGGERWERVATFAPTPRHLRGLVVLGTR